MADLVHERIHVGAGVSVHVVRGRLAGAPSVVLLPGYADSWWSYARVLPGLVEALDVVLIDARGHGDSDRPVCCYGVTDVANDVVAVLDALDMPRAALVGHSGSCFAARRVALQHPSRVSALGLIASPLAMDREGLEPFLDQVRSLDDALDEDFIRDFQVGAAHLPLPEWFVARLVAESAKVPANVWKATLDGLVAYRDEEELGAITAPTTLLWGDRDPIVPREEQERLKIAIPGASLVVIPETGHSPHWERPEDTIEVLIELVQREG
jgi:non-heme chloroperoxidase